MKFLTTLKSRMEEIRVSNMLLLWVVINTILFVLVLLLTLVFPRAIPFSLFHFWGYSDVWGGIKASWPILAWASGLTFLVVVFTRNSQADNMNAKKLLGKETATSIMAGLFEEICFRWLLFFLFIITAQFFNIILFGLPKFLYVKITAPVINFFTFGKVKWLLFQKKQVGLSEPAPQQQMPGSGTATNTKG